MGGGGGAFLICLILWKNCDELAFGLKWKDILHLLKMVY